MCFPVSSYRTSISVDDNYKRTPILSTLVAINIDIITMHDVSFLINIDQPSTKGIRCTVNHIKDPVLRLNINLIGINEGTNEWFSRP